MAQRFRKAFYARRTYAEEVRIKERAFRQLEASLIQNKILREQLWFLARLAADTPQFDNPLIVSEAKRLRDHILKGEFP